MARQGVATWKAAFEVQRLSEAGKLDAMQWDLRPEEEEDELNAKGVKCPTPDFSPAATEILESSSSSPLCFPRRMR